MPEFRSFPKIPRFEKFLKSPIVLTEKLDGTNACVVIEQVNDGLQHDYIDTWVDGDDVEWGMFAQSRKRIITPEKDNYGFANWVATNTYELWKLGHGHHYGEWWGGGIQRNYGLDKDDKRFSLFNVNRPVESLPDCVSLVPVLGVNTYDTDWIDMICSELECESSHAVPGFTDPEGVIMWHGGIRQYFKMPFDPKPKGVTKAEGQEAARFIASTVR